MFVLGHPGITLGAAAALAAAMARRNSLQTATAVSARAEKTSWLTLLARRMDIRLLLVGSFLPDIIDKPVGQVFFKDTFSDGRIFSHTILFLVLVSLAGVYLYRSQHRTWLLVLAFGTFMHLILDEMWLNPRTLFWPILGFTFERIDLTTWALDIWRALFTEPRVYVPEAIGGVILLWFGLALIRRRRLAAFIRRGQVE